MVVLRLLFLFIFILYDLNFVFALRRSYVFRRWHQSDFICGRISGRRCLCSFEVGWSSYYLFFLYIISGRRRFRLVFHSSTMRDMSFGCCVLKFSLAMRTLSHVFIILSRNLTWKLFDLSFLFIWRYIRVLFDFLNFLRNQHSHFKWFSFTSPFGFFLFTSSLFWSFNRISHSLYWD